MKIECTKENLRRAVAATERVTGKNLPLPILGSILCVARKKSFSLHATNLDVGITYTIPARIDQEGSVAIPGSVLLGFIQNIFNDTKINLEITGNTVLIQTDHNTATLKTISTEDFPQIKELSKEEALVSFTLTSDILCEALKSVSYAAAISDIKPEIASVNIRSTGDTLVFLATDSFRLAEKKVPHKKIKETPKEDFSVLVPIKNVSDIIRVFGDSKDLIEVRVGTNQMSFVSKDIYFTTRLISAVFPDLSQVFPTKILTEVVLEKEDLMGAIKMSSVFSDKFNRVQVRVLPQEGLFEINSKTGEAGENTSMLNGAISGEEIEMNFNAKYILDVFNSISNVKVGIYFSDKDKPVMVRGEQDASFAYLLMPLHS